MLDGLPSYVAAASSPSPGATSSSAFPTMATMYNRIDGNSFPTHAKSSGGSTGSVYFLGTSVTAKLGQATVLCSIFGTLPAV